MLNGQVEMRTLVSAVDCPAIDVPSVMAALEALRQGRSLASGHPLAHFLSLYDPSADMLLVEDNLASDIRIFDGLSRVIQQHVARCRQFHHQSNATPAQDKDMALEALCQDFRHHSVELEAWSLLYYRYVCVNLSLALDEISALVGQNKRTLHRRQQFGVQRLTHELVRLERQSRCQHQQYVLRARLPATRPPFLIGRDHPLESALRQLHQPQSPRHLILYGAPGVGKSAIVLPTS
jgi:hypothetical protein